MNDSNGEGKAEYSDDFDSSDDDGKIEWINYLHVPYVYNITCSERELNSLKLQL